MKTVNIGVLGRMSGLTISLEASLIFGNYILDPREGREERDVDERGGKMGGRSGPHCCPSRLALPAV